MSGLCVLEAPILNLSICLFIPTPALCLVGISEIQAYNYPPPAVATVMGTTFTILGVHPSRVGRCGCMEATISSWVCPRRQYDAFG